MGFVTMLERTMSMACDVYRCWGWVLVLWLVWVLMVLLMVCWVYGVFGAAGVCLLVDGW